MGGLHPHRDVKIARRRAHGAGVALARHPQPRADARSRRECAPPPFPHATTRPSPWHVGQAFFSCPVPPQRGQVRLNFIAPAICVTCPAAVALRTDDRLAARRTGAVAGVADFLTCDIQRDCVPRMACQKSMLSPYSRSEPFSGLRALFRARLAAEKLARKYRGIRRRPAAAGRAPACARHAAGHEIREIESAEVHIPAVDLRPAPGPRPAKPFSE